MTAAEVNRLLQGAGRCSEIYRLITYTQALSYVCYGYKHGQQYPESPPSMYMQFVSPMQGVMDAIEDGLRPSIFTGPTIYNPILGVRVPIHVEEAKPPGMLQRLTRAGSAWRLRISNRLSR